MTDGDPGAPPPEYKVYRSRPGLFDRMRSPGEAWDRLRRNRQLKRRLPGQPQRGKAYWVKRVVKWVVLAAVAWVLLSVVLFFISAQVNKGLPTSAEQALSGSGNLLSGSTVLVIGSDQRPAGEHEPGASGPSRSDTLMLLRASFGSVRRLSIPRDSYAAIPGHGSQKINAAYAFGGAALSIDTIEAYLGVPINHLIEVDFDNFPKLIDALGGIDVTTGRVCSEISGGKRNGGWTLNLKRGTHHLDGEQALVLARTRKNSCNPAEDDLTRAKRQQQILSGMKDQAFSPGTFFRLPWVSWAAPKAMRTDMGGPTLLGFFGAAAVGGTPPTQVLRPSGFETLPDGGSGLVVSEADKQAAVKRFMDG